MIVLNIGRRIRTACVPPAICAPWSARRHTASRRARQVLPRNHPVDLQKRLVLGVKTGIPVPKIEKPHLTHQPPSSAGCSSAATTAPVSRSTACSGLYASRYQQIVNHDSKVDDARSNQVHTEVAFPGRHRKRPHDWPRNLADRLGEAVDRPCCSISTNCRRS